ncbi:MAG: hypothetical protein ACLUV3_05420 [Oscillospiraceae bacterium]
MPKSHWIISIIISCVIIIVTLLSLKSCGIYPEWVVKHAIEKSLEEKYGEEFYCYDVWGGGKGVCLPKKNRDIRFEVLFHTGGEIVEEGYYAACVAEQIEEDVQKELENVFNDFYLHSCMTVPLKSREVDDIYAENVRNESFDIDEYVSLVKEKREGRTSISLIILVNSEKPNMLSFEEEYQTMSDFCRNIKDHDINPILYLKFIPEEEYSECIEYLETREYPYSTFKDMVRDYPVKVSDTSLDICFEFEGDTPITITLEEYINQRKEVN